MYSVSSFRVSVNCNFFFIENLTSANFLYHNLLDYSIFMANFAKIFLSIPLTLDFCVKLIF